MAEHPTNDVDSDELPKDLGSLTPGYRRALWIVALLNVAYACVEVVASSAGRSEALKAVRAGPASPA
jgi:Co/Zn/Cd efflux system component